MSTWPGLPVGVLGPYTLRCTLTVEPYPTAMTRTNLTLPPELIAGIDAQANPRGRSAYVAELVP